MKRFILIISALLLVGAIDVSAKPKQLTPTITWELQKNGILIIKGTGRMPDFKSREDTPWAKKATKIKGLKINEGITHIGNNSFSNRIEKKGDLRSANKRFQLATVNLPSYSLNSIGDMAFRGNYALKFVVIPNGVTSIGTYAFAECSIEDLSIPSTLRKISSSAFFFNSIESLHIPEGVTHIGESAFHENKISKLFLPSTLEYIGDYAFCNTFYISNCTIYDLIIPENVKSIGDGAFHSKKFIGSISFNSKLQHIGKDCFSYLYMSDKERKFNGELINLPAFVTHKNCEYYGISKKAYKRAYPSSHDLATKATEEDDPDKALELYLKGTTAREEEGEKFTRSDCYFGAGLIYSTEKNDNHKAIEMWEKADKLESNASEFIKGLIAKAKEDIELEELHKKTKEYLSNKDYANAIKCYQRLYEINKSKDTAKQIAELLLKINDYDMALKYYLEVGDMDSCCAVPEYFENKKDYQNAIKYYRRVAEMGNNGVERYAVWRIASLQFNYLQDYASAFEGFKLYKTDHKDHKDVYKVPEKYKAMGDYANAIKYYKKIYDEFNEERAAQQLIELYLKTGRYNEAIEFYSPAARNGDKEVQYKLAQVYEKAKNKNMAIFWYKKSAEQKYLAAEEALAKYGVYVDNRPKTTQTTSSANSSSSKSNSHNHNHNDVHINTYQPEYGYRDVWKPCTSCGGSGRCSNCNGTGQKLYGGTHKILSDCPVCHGGRCSICYGQGGHYEKEMYQIR